MPRPLTKLRQNPSPVMHLWFLMVQQRTVNTKHKPARAQRLATQLRHRTPLALLAVEVRRRTLAVRSRQLAAHARHLVALLRRCTQMRLLAAKPRQHRVTLWRLVVRLTPRSTPATSLARKCARYSLRSSRRTSGHRPRAMQSNHSLARPLTMVLLCLMVVKEHSLWVRKIQDNELALRLRHACYEKCARTCKPGL